MRSPTPEGDGPESPAAAVKIEIRTRAGGTVCCSPDDIIPRRLGLLLQRRRLVLEYGVQGTELLAHHSINVVLPDAAEGPTSQGARATTVAEKLQIAHAPWLHQVAPSQLVALVDRIQRHAEAAKSPSLAPVVAPLQRSARPLGSEEAEELRALLLGRSAAGGPGLPKEWLQGWGFEPEAQATCPYGLRQAEGGPCGVVAPVQAFLLADLLSDGISPPAATASQCRAALTKAMTEVLWRCAQSNESVVRVLVMPSGRSLVGGLRSPAGCEVHEFNSVEALRDAWERPPLKGCYFEEGGGDGGGGKSIGVLLFLYSAMASHGPARVRKDADAESDAAMIGAHGYCTQEAVNLLLTGAASSNVFDGERRLGGERPEDPGLLLRGVAERPEVGFLSLFEAFGSLEVGHNLKDPTWPVWVAHAESHYSVLFGAAGAPRPGEEPADNEADVWYYDPLGRQDEEKRITVRPGQLAEPPDEDDLEANGMIAKVIRTRWGAKADLDWNGAEPIY